MSAQVAELRSEAAWDALVEEMPIVLSVMRGVRTADALTAAGVLDATNAERRLSRLTRAGLLRRVGAGYEAVADVIEQTRQEGLITSLSRAVLPLVTRVANDERAGLFEQIDLELDRDAQTALHRNRVQPLLEAVGKLSDESAADDPVPASMIVVGTSDVPAAADRGERLIETVRRAARQRATPGDAERALLIEGHTTIGRSSLARAEALVRACAAELAPRASPNGKRPAYTLALIFCARDTRAGFDLEVGDGA